MERYLTKSRFKIALECHAKLFYTNKQEYADSKMDDEFLKALAEGGFQVGELAKFMFTEDPVEEQITVTERSYEAALNATQQMMTVQKLVIAEAAVNYKNLFIRTDLLKINYDKKIIELYEVKAKSFDKETEFTTKKGRINSKWEAYLMDVAFQRYVVEKAYPEYKVAAYLILADKTKAADVDGLNQMFKIKKNGDRSAVEIKAGLKQHDLGRMILTAVQVDNEINYIFNHPYEDYSGREWKFEDLIDYLSDKYEKDEKMFAELGGKCKNCEYRATEEEKRQGKKSGFEECWKAQAKFVDADFLKPMVFDMLMIGTKGKLDEWIKDGKYFIEDLEEADLMTKNPKPQQKPGLSNQDRKLLQLEKVIGNDHLPFLDTDGLQKEFSEFIYPLHFIDFETAMVAVPFNKGRHPYEGIAFQFSHHQVNEDGSIEHKGQFLKTEAGEFPNYDFVRALKSELENDNGTIFRYHTHENTYLNHIYRQLKAETNTKIPDKDELISFIQSITHRTEDKKLVWTGERDMVDLAILVFRYYYAPQAKGSYSIKKILPAVIENSEFIRNKYNKPIYGGNAEIRSLNYTQPKIWISPEWGNDPYKALEPVFDGYTVEDFPEDTETGIEEIHQGGAAATAYARLQFSHIPEFERQKVNSALLHYCELDTLAMVMIWEYWKHELDKNTK